MQSKSTSLYDVPRETLWVKYSPYLQGDSSSMLCIVTRATLSSDARSALLSSIQRLGYGLAYCIITLEPENHSPLEGKELLEVIETLDPLALICCQNESAIVLANAYRTGIPLDAPGKLLGRPICAFSDFDKMLQRADTKQKAWQLIKSLPAL